MRVRRRTVSCRLRHTNQTHSSVRSARPRALCEQEFLSSSLVPNRTLLVQLLAEVVMSLQVFEKQHCQDHERKHQDYIKKGFTHRNLK